MLQYILFSTMNFIFLFKKCKLQSNFFFVSKKYSRRNHRKYNAYHQNDNKKARYNERDDMQGCLQSHP